MLKLLPARVGKRWQPSSLTICHIGRPAWTRYFCSSTAIEENFSDQPETSRKKSPGPFSKHEIQTFKDLRTMGLSLRAITDRLPGRSHWAVKAMSASYERNELGVEDDFVRGPWSANDNTKLVEMRENGASWQEIQSEFPRRSRKMLMKQLGILRHEIKRTFPQKYKAWSADEIAQIHQAAIQGKTTYEVAKELGRTVHSVRSKWRDTRQVGQAHWKSVDLWQPGEDQQILQMRKSGLSAGEIAAKIGRSIGSVDKRWEVIRPARQRDMFRRSVALTATDMDKIALELNNGSSWRQIHETLFPDHPFHTVLLAFRRFTGHTAMQRKPPIRYDLSRDDIQSIQQKRKTGFTWIKIRDLMLPEHSDKGAFGFTRAFNRAVDRQNSTLKEIQSISASTAPTSVAQDSRAIYALSPHDVREIEQMRGCGNTWAQILELRYPKYRWKNPGPLRNAFIRSVRRQRAAEFAQQTTDERKVSGNINHLLFPFKWTAHSGSNV